MMKASPWVSPQMWQAQLAPQVIRNVGEDKLQAPGLDEDIILHAPAETHEQVALLLRKRFITPSYHWCIRAIVEVVLSHPPRTAKGIWEALVVQRDLRPDETDEVLIQEWAEYCLSFILAWRKVTDVIVGG